MRDLCMLDYHTIHNGMLAAFAERWHPETSSFHLPHGEITIILDDVACLLHLPIRGTLFHHDRITKEEAQEMLIAELGADPNDALEEVQRIRGAHVRFSFLQRQYVAQLIAAHREQALRCYFLYLIGAQLFVDTSSSYIDIVYLTYLSDITHIHEYNWGATTLLVRGEVPTYTEVMSRASAFTPLRGNQVSDPYRSSLDRMAAEDIKYY
ncbi:protein MAIN-LIKE 1-like [Vicia villosa]|uniref:protein MAIN-LIKE 1-like n=1 Tax=Vicia villosa TaxID=3911 RepID=UPI00273B425F|nr:protein MAIN-LIKE 1-like [Vicia villosa]